MTGPDMNDEQRLLDGAGSELTRLMIASARDEQPSARALQRTLLAVSAGAAVVGVAAAAGGAAAQASTTTSVGMIAKWLGIGAAAGLLTAGAALEIERRFAEPAPSALQATLPAVPEPIADPQPERAPAPRPIVELDQPQKPVPARAGDRARAPAAAPEQPVLVEDDPSLAAEVARLDRARQALANGDATRALGELGAYDREFPAGRLGPEALLLRMEAAERRGDRAAAERAARELLRAHPKSPHAARARAVLGASQNP